MKEEENIEDLFRSSFEDFEVTPPAQLKERIDARLDERGTSLLRWIGFSVVLVVTAGLIALILNLNPEKPSKQVAQQDAGTVNQEHIVTSENAGYSNYTSSVHTQSGAQTSAKATHKTKQPKNSRHAHFGTHEKGKSFEKKSSGKTKKSGHKSGKTKSGKSRKFAVGETPLQYMPPNDDMADATEVPPGDSFGKSSGQGENGSSGGDERGMNTTTPPSDSGSVTPLIPDSSVTLADGTNTSSGSGNNSGNAASNSWTASLYGAPYPAFPAKSLAASRTLKSAGGVQFSAELNRSFYKGLGITSGIGYTAFSERLSQLSSVLDSVMVIDSIIGDSVQGFDTIYGVSVDTTTMTYSQLIRVQTFSIPVLLSYQRMLGDHWGILGRGGVIMRFHSVRSEAADPQLPPVTVNPFTVAFTGRIHAVYKWNHWMVSAGGTCLSIPKSPVMYDGKSVPRTVFTAEFGIHYTF